VNLPRWLARLLERWSSEAPLRAAPPAPREIDIDLTREPAVPPGESTDYDVHSLGEPIDPPAISRRAR
jgi:hypothetical protein